MQGITDQQKKKTEPKAHLSNILNGMEQEAMARAALMAAVQAVAVSIYSHPAVTMLCKSKHCLLGIPARTKGACSSCNSCKNLQHE